MGILFESVNPPLPPDSITRGVCYLASVILLQGFERVQCRILDVCYM